MDTLKRGVELKFYTENNPVVIEEAKKDLCMCIKIRVISRFFYEPIDVEIDGVKKKLIRFTVVVVGDEPCGRAFGTRFSRCDYVSSFWPVMVCGKEV